MLESRSGGFRRSFAPDVGQSPATLAASGPPTEGAAAIHPDAKGNLYIEYDRPVSTFGQFGDERVNMVARQLDENLENVLQKAANEFD
jgi:hypothetical protein